ncbi:hypothetical protein GLOIN_2v1871769 [Rhizophagus irregularis DAOM 181602=DAOM 197198]|uniref:Uncharacterized protein n=1 Tax=Rhizophagus irregularis (strain DAOM 181602 / DAOM 197198 / MUCL 43194) TaxID=747089 RepID=A0A2P4QH43_RHIID|nr:hypothetical protein GLOIN_2v1871769 [Rhizophagus irregularis DAOM 181602=DAOM 197198]POG76953.1 hypothetical protein GLOIN_2v1871769 [Rhizophagus irregularis DAOM 181602=DAOM 197198]|eukprot:XP_025183819.1 hypothetical protein GLOIN_2v1871769 [Rhizophagus irregularis DAOM 181602=DAOM 197198]
MSSFNRRNQERTHEDSRRTILLCQKDRSMEARIESARKASDIHKKRTGRALRITAEDVRNEEMYQEIDPDEEAKLDKFHREVIGENR